MMDALLDYCAAQPGMLVVPIDVLSADGLDPVAAEAYAARGLLSNTECERIDTMIRKYCERAAKLGRASRQWFPPRVQHLCLVTDGVRTRPYFQPFHASSWLLYREDVAPDTSSLEFSIFLLFQAERQVLQQQIGASLLTNLPYLLILDDDQLADFIDGCRKSARPDAAGYRALADALPELRTMHHEVFRRPTVAVSGAQRLANGLIADAGQQQVLERLQRDWMQAIEAVVAAHRNTVRRPAARAGRSLVDWLDDENPHLVVTGEQGEVLWRAAGTGSPTLASVLAGATPEAEASILADLEVIDRRSRAFLDSLADPAALARPASWMTAGGLSYIHGDTLRIAYSLTDDPERLRHASPPYERWMLAARTVHEWGHQAAESGWVRVDPERVEERKARERALVESLDQLVDALPAGLHRPLTGALGRAGDADRSPGETMLAGLLRRIDDYMANLLARHYLSADEMDTYVRNNVGARLLDYAPEQALTHLLRVAYEFQYLSLSTIRDPERWFMDSTWFDSLFAAPGVCSRARFLALTDRIAAICDTYSIDADRIRLPDGSD
ncbi:hypothetical protein [Halomonas denitrificans]|nr:hypothetical protein [Halomonas denitrificans]